MIRKIQVTGTDGNKDRAFNIIQGFHAMCYKDEVYLLDANIIYKLIEGDVEFKIFSSLSGARRK